MPLSDADIFKAKFYSFYKAQGDIEEEKNFISYWRELEAVCREIFHPTTGASMDEFFTRYIYYARTNMGIKSTTTEALCKFYEKDKYTILKNEATFQDWKVLANFGTTSMSKTSIGSLMRPQKTTRFRFCLQWYVGLFLSQSTSYRTKTKMAP